MRKLFGIVPAAILIFSLACSAQSIARVAYDSISITPSKSASPRSSAKMNDDSIVATNVPLRKLVEYAYGIKPGLIYGLDDTVASRRYDVAARRTSPLSLPKGSNYSSGELLLQNLLATRFQLSAHIQDRILAVYELQRAAGDVKFLPAGAQPLVRNDRNKYDLQCTNTPMTKFADWLTYVTHRIVVDDTGLTGRYDLDVTMPPRTTPGYGGPAGYSQVDPHPLPVAGWTLLRASLQEQLGLILQPAERPVKTLTIDHVELASR